MKILPALLFALSALSLAAAQPTQAQQVYIPNNETFNSTAGILFIGESAQDAQSSPTVDVVTGALANQAYLDNDSVVNATGGAIENYEPFSGSMLNFSGGTTGVVKGLDNSTINFSGGTAIELHNEEEAALLISGGTVSDYVNSTGGTTTVTGGTFDVGDDDFQDDIDADFIFEGIDLSSVVSSVSDPYTTYTLSGTLENWQSINGDQIQVES
jgi:hypothetical protein